jgi:hypothetical protein
MWTFEAQQEAAYLEIRMLVQGKVDGAQESNTIAFLFSRVKFWKSV